LLQVPPWLQQALDKAQGSSTKDLLINPQLLVLGSKDNIEIWADDNVEIAGDCISDSGNSYYSEDSIANNADFISFF
jgi:hypothetical protein